MINAQPGILAPVPPLAKYLLFRLAPGSAALPALQALAQASLGDAVVGLGSNLVQAAGGTVAGLHTFPTLDGVPMELPATPYALVIWLRGDDRGELAHRARDWQQRLQPTLTCVHLIDAFRHGEGRDLTGYEDGTENPVEAAAEAAALVGSGPLAGSSYLALQQWQHDFARFDAMPQPQQDLAIGRQRSDNEEIDDAPASAHVKRTAQESFTPEAFMLRRSMPWSEGQDMGLMFAAFGHSFAAFEAQWRRMTGLEDGIVDALFQFTRPLSGAYFWCPPQSGDRLDLRAVLPAAR